MPQIKFSVGIYGSDADGLYGKTFQEQTDFSYNAIAVSQEKITLSVSVNIILNMIISLV